MVNQPKIIHYLEAPPQYPFQGNTKVRMRILIGEEDAPTYIMRIFEVEPGGVIPRHEHPWEHEIFILKGRMRVRIGEEEYEVSEGYAIYIPPNVPHEYINDSNETVIFICTIPKQKK